MALIALHSSEALHLTDEEKRTQREAGSDPLRILVASDSRCAGDCGFLARDDLDLEYLLLAE